MATNCDYGHSAMLREQYQRDMELISLALQEESEDEREERLNLVAHAWSLTTECLRSQMEPSDVPAYAPVAAVRP